MSITSGVKFTTLEPDPIREWKKTHRGRITKIASKLNVSVTLVSLVLHGQRRHTRIESALRRLKAPIRRVKEVKSGGVPKVSVQP